jgi:hypothetical protein
VTPRYYLGACLAAFVCGVIVTAIMLVSMVESAWPTISGTQVPNDVRCQEDEVIHWTGTDILGCVHVENVYRP